MTEATNGALVVREQLPAIANYERAKQALAQCDDVDEVKDISDKAIALQVYAKQAKDSTLEDTAKRIRLRASQRMGELLQSVPVSPGGRPPKTKGTAPKVSRKTVAEDAGISEQQRKDAERVASVPKEEFERIVEQPNPPTPRQLADKVANKRPRKPVVPLDSSADITMRLVKFAVWLRGVDLDALAADQPNVKLEDIQWACLDIEDGITRIMETV